VKDLFSITISDVHGSRDYTFNQLMRKFALYSIIFILFVMLASAGAIWWLTKETNELEQKRAEAQIEHQKMLAQKQEEYIRLDKAKRALQLELDNKSKQAQFLDQTLQGLEDLIGVSPNENQPVVDRVKIVQLNTIEKKLMLEAIPNGRPVKIFEGISSKFGWRIHPVTGKREFHRGLDYRGKIGNPIIATADGVVEYSGYHKKSGYGNLVIIDHVNGFRTLFGHMSKRLVKSGDFVHKGQIIGRIGSTGLSSGPHVHYEVSFIQRKLNPVPFVNWNLKHYNQIFKQVKEVPWGSLTQNVKKRVQTVEKQLSLRVVK